MSSSTFTSPPRIPPPPLIPGKSPARNAADITSTSNPPQNTAALTPSPPKRKPSLASPSPPMPFIPSFNLATSPPGGLPATPVTSSSQTQSQSQYVTVFQRPTCPMSSPESPTSRAMMKRLLAKPAAPVPYSGSESEGRSVGGMKRAATIAGSGNGSARKSEDGRVNEGRRRATTSEQRVPMAAGNAFSGSDSGVSNTSGRRNPQEIDKLPSSTPPRKLLRRKPSSSRVTSPSSSPSHPNTSAAVLTLAPHEPSSKPPPLTPASALVQAYRAQEQSQRDPDASPPSKSPSTPRPFSSSDPKHIHDNDPATPYYTVFGSSLDRVIPVDSLEARTAGIGWSSEGYFGSEGIQRSGTVKSTSSVGGGLRTLTRKVSGRWKKAQQHAGEEEKEKEGGRIRPRPSLQNPDGRKSDVGVRTRTRMRTRSLLVEGPVSDAVHPPPLKALIGKVNDQERGRRHARRPSSAENPPPVPSEGGGNKLWRLMKRISAGGLRDKYRAEQHETSAPPPLPQPVPGSAFTFPSPLALDAGKSRALARLLPSASSSRSSLVGGESRSRSKVRTAPALKTSGSPSHQQGQAQGSETTRSSSPVSSSDTLSKSEQSAHSSTSSFRVADVQGEQVVPPVPRLANVLRKNSRKQQQGVNAVGKYIVHPSQLCQDLPPTPPPPSFDAKKSLNHLSVRQPPRPRTADSEDWMMVQSPGVELPSLPFPPRRGITTLVVSSPDMVVSSAAPTQDDSPAPAPARGTRKKKERNEEQEDRAGGRESPLLPEFSISGAINTFRPRKSGDSVALKPPPLSVPIVPSAGSSTSPRRSGSSPMRSASSPTSRSPTSPKSPSHHTRKSECHTNTNRRSEGGLSILTIRPGRRRSSSCDLSTTADAFKSVVHGEGSKADRMGSLNPPPATAARSPASAAKSPANSMTSPTSSKKSPPSNSPATTPASTTSRPTGTPSTTSYTPSRRHALTEQEKAQRWDDLLERSARAGGTLHLAGDWDVLQSDLLRYSSTPSELEMACVGVLG